MSTNRRLRVAMVGGAWPTDTSYLRELAGQVQLSFHHSCWMHIPMPEPQDVDGVERRAHRPLVGSKRGHLAFIYPGLHQALSAARPDVVHVISEPWGLLAVQAALWTRAHPRSRLVLHGCDTIWHHGRPVKQLGRRALLKLTMGALDGYAAENAMALQRARENGLRRTAPLARIHTNPRDAAIWCPPDTPQRAAARAALGLDDETVAFGMVGRLVPEKGVVQFLEAARLLHGRGIPGRYFVAGRGPLADRVAEYAPFGVELLGSLEHPGGVRDLFHALDVFACPSLRTPTWEDQGPRALLEAMMCGLVPMASATGGIPEMLADHGVLAADCEVQSIADGLEKAAVAAGDPATRDDVCEYSTSVYSGAAAAEQLLELWHLVASKDRR